MLSLSSWSLEGWQPAPRVARGWGWSPVDQGMVIGALLKDPRDRDGLEGCSGKMSSIAVVVVADIVKNE